MKVSKETLKQMALECLETYKLSGADLAEICEEYAACGGDVNPTVLYEEAQMLL